MERPSKEEYAEYYHRYIELVPTKKILELFNDQIDEMRSLLEIFSEEKSLYRYSPEKWSVKEVVGHINEAERIFSYRALRFARNDKKDLPGYDHDEYIRQSNYDNIKLADLADEFCALRKSNILLFKNFSEEMQLRKGTANNNTITVRALAYVMAGHVNHHLNVLKEKYAK